MNLLSLIKMNIYQKVKKIAMIIYLLIQLNKLKILFRIKSLWKIPIIKIFFQIFNIKEFNKLYLKK